MAGHPLDMWRDDFDELGLIEWAHAHSAYSMDVWKRRDRDAFDEMYTAQFEVRSTRKMGTPTMRGAEAIDAAWTFSDWFPDSETRILRAVPPGTLMRRHVRHDADGNTLVFLSVVQFRGGRRSLMVGFDDSDEMAAVAEFERLAAEY